MPDTVAIHHPLDPTRPTLIRADRYDPDRHTLWGTRPEETTDEDAAPDAEEERADEEDRALSDAQAVDDDLSEPDADS